MKSPKPSCTVELFWKIDPIEKGTFSPTDEKRTFVCVQSKSVKSVVDDIKFRLFLRKDDGNISVYTFLEISKPDFPGAIVFEVTGQALSHVREWNVYKVTSDDPFVWEFSSNVSKAFIGLVSREHHLDLEVTLKVDIFVQQITANAIVEQLITDESLSDVTIKVGEMGFKAQKCILAMHSEFLKRTFEQVNAWETRDGTFFVKGFSYETVKTMINFLYGRVDHEDLAKNVVEVLRLADQYEVQSLKDYAVGILEDSVKQSPVQIAELAHRHNVPHLLQMCADYVEANFEEVKKSEDWHSLENRNRDVLRILIGQDGQHPSNAQVSTEF